MATDPLQSAAETRPELTFRAVALGLVLSAVLGAANVYLGLKVGMTVSASIPAAVVAMLLLRVGARGAGILEANQVQTAASAGESLAAGILFTVPALVLIGVWTHFDFWTTTGIAIAGGWLGVLFMIPMRRVFIEESPELPYPEGVACAAVLAAGQDPSAEDSTLAVDGGQARAVLQGGLLGALVKIASSGLGWVAGSLESALALGGTRALFIGGDLSPALVAVGAIVGLGVSSQIFLGGAIGWWLLIPSAPEWVPALASDAPALVSAISPAFEGSASDRAFAIWSAGVRYVGVGAMAVGGLAALVRVRVGLVRAVKELLRGLRVDRTPEAQVDLAARPLALAIAVAITLVAVLYWRFTGNPGITLLATAIMTVASFFFVGVASYIVGLVGNSNSPVSGMTITAVLGTGGLLWLFGYTGVEGMVATLGVAAVVCCAACTAGDVCNDLKTGQIVGATPRRQQTMQLLGVVVAALVMAPVLQLLHDAYEIGSRELAAPQASLFASLARGFFGDAQLPWNLVALGAAIGLVILGLDAGLARRADGPRLHLMPIAVGLYLPFGLAVPIFLGGCIAWAGSRSLGRQATPAHPSAGPTAAGPGVLFASGVVAGEALTGVGIALALTLGLAGSPATFAGRGALSLAVGVAVLVAFWRATRSADRTV